MNIEVSQSVIFKLAEGTLSSCPDDRYLDEIVAYPDDCKLFIPTAAEVVVNRDGLFEPGDENRLLWWQEGELIGFYIEEIISIINN
jgi:hypothetical protein